MRLSRPLQDVATMNALLNTAEDLALRAGESLPGPEHLLLSALALPDGTARRAFERLGADPDAFAPAIARAHADALAAVGVHVADEASLDADVARNRSPKRGVMRTTAPAQEAFQAATKQAKAEKSRLLGAHVVAAVAGQEQGTAVRALRVMGVEPADLSEAARAELAA
ncbi:Clp protease N-terminal domain-containing protein [Streptomyces sp. NPDC018031]|uniref:Clp protease N-terminal domain-containing protein n=1 Tax=Streptomyces sp. NPDC018031 TaxID=3365033 RepID=UPI0037A00B2E